MGLVVTDYVIPHCMGLEGIEEVGYFIAMVYPIPETGMALHTFHSRVGKCPAEIIGKVMADEKLVKS